MTSRRLVLLGFAVLLAVVPAVHAQNYPLVCHGGSALRLGFESGSRGVAGAYLIGSFRPSPSPESVAEGQCSWEDRTFRKGEPLAFCLSANPGDLGTGPTLAVIRALSDPAGSIRLSVSNNNAGCLVVAGIEPAKSSIAQRAAISSSARESALAKARASAVSQSGTHPATIDSYDVSADSLPKPSMAQGLMLQAYSDRLQKIAQAALAPAHFKSLEAQVRGCGDVYCAINYRIGALGIEFKVQ
jgi:hypothetical protein